MIDTKQNEPVTPLPAILHWLENNLENPDLKDGRYQHWAKAYINNEDRTADSARAIKRLIVGESEFKYFVNAAIMIAEHR